jgi:hypothetical protein
MAAQGSSLVVASQAAAGRVVTLEVFSAAASSNKQLALEQTVSLQVPCPEAKAQLTVVSLYGNKVALTWSSSTATVLELPPPTTSQQQQQQQQQVEASSSHVVHLHQHLPSCTAAAASGARGSKKGATKAAAGGTGSGVGLNTGQCLLLSGHHLLAWTLASDSSSSSSSVQFSYVLLDSQHGCQLGCGSLPLEVSPQDVAAGGTTCTPATLPGSNSSSSAQLALMVGGAVYVLHLPLPRADLAGLVGRLAVGYPSTSPNTPPAAAAAAGLVQVEQVLHEGTLLQQGLAGVLAQGAGSISSTCWLALGDPASAGEAVGVAGVRALEAAAQKAADALAAAKAAGGTGQQTKSKPLVAAVKGLVAELEAQQQQRAALNKQHQQQYRAAEQQKKEQAAVQQQQAAAAAEGSAKARKGRAQKKEDQENDASHAPPQQQQQSAPLSHPSKVSLSEVLLGQLATALAEQQQHDLLAQLLALQPLPTLVHAPQLLELLVRHQQYHLVTQVCSHARQVPAAALVGALQQLLSRGTGTEAPAAQQQYWQRLHGAAEARIAELDAAAAAALEAKKHHVAGDCLALAKHTAAALEGFSPRQVCCHCLLAADFDNVELQAALKALGPQQLLRLMKYLSRWVELYLSSGVYAEAKQASSSRVLLQPREAAVCKSNFDLVTPSWCRVLEWCQVVLDAQLTALALMPVAGNQLADLAAQLQQTAAGTGQLLPLKGLLEHLSAGAPLPQAAVAANARYTVELLDLRVRPVQ